MKQDLTKDGELIHKGIKINNIIKSLKRKEIFMIVVKFYID